MPKNLEFKAQVKELAQLETEFKENGAAFFDVLEQRDTYFRVSHGRLKLRETVGKKAELIFYERDEASAAAMESRYTVFPIHDLGLKEILLKALGVTAVVEKERRLLKLMNARIHLDEVKGLGSFLEFEVVSEGDDHADAALLTRLKTIAAPFVTNAVNASYSDLVSRR